ncbi:MAG: RsfS/YbeB/iojap family protein, partial [Actinomycetota bacterium]|nr:RsfS/YbeB/iojap family protein [Actinomycetota bacterium]
MRPDESVVRRESFGTEGEALTREMAVTAARAASEMFAKDVTIVDLRGLVSYADYFVIASAETERQTRRVAEEVIETM